MLIISSIWLCLFVQHMCFNACIIIVVHSIQRRFFSKKKLIFEPKKTSTHFEEISHYHTATTIFNLSPGLTHGFVYVNKIFFSLSSIPFRHSHECFHSHQCAASRAAMKKQTVHSKKIYFILFLYIFLVKFSNNFV